MFTGGWGQHGTRENCVISSFFILFTEGDSEQIKDSVVDGTCSTQGGNEKQRKRDLLGKYEEKRPLGTLGCRWKVNGVCIQKFMMLLLVMLRYTECAKVASVLSCATLYINGLEDHVS